MKKNMGALIGIAAAGLLLWVVSKGKAQAASPGTGSAPVGTTAHTISQNGQTTYVAADPNNVLMRNKISGQTTWVPNSAAAAYLAGGEWIVA